MTARTMHSVAERTSGSVAAIFCCADRLASAAGSAEGPVATATMNATPKSGADIMQSPHPACAAIAGNVGEGQSFFLGGERARWFHAAAVL
jgi:hypothetical protein